MKKNYLFAVLALAVFAVILASTFASAEEKIPYWGLE